MGKSSSVNPVFLLPCEGGIISVGAADEADLLEISPSQADIARDGSTVCAEATIVVGEGPR